MTHKNTICFNSECLISTYLNLQLILASTLSSIAGDMVEFKGDFQAAFVAASPTSVPTTTSTVDMVDLKVTLDGLSKSLTKICKASLDRCVWDFGKDVGKATLSVSPQSNGYVFSHAGHSWRSNEHPNLTLVEAGVRQSGDEVIFTSDFQALAASAGPPGTIDVTVVLLDRSKSWTTTARAPLDRDVWTWGTEVGMRKLTTGPLSNYGYVLRCGGSEWRSNRHPRLTLKDCGVTSGDVIEFLGDFEPPKWAAESQSLVEVHVTLLDNNKDETGLRLSNCNGLLLSPKKKGIQNPPKLSLIFCHTCFSVGFPVLSQETHTYKTSLDKGVWRFGEECGMQTLKTSSLSNFGYVFHLGENAWRKAHHPNLTLVDAGVKPGDTIKFTGDFEQI